MEITALDIYLISVVGDVGCVLVSLGIVGLVVGATFASVSFVMSEAGDAMGQASLKYTKALLLASSALLVIGTLIPSTRTIAAMYVIPPIVNNEKVQQLPNELLDLAGEWVKSTKEELSNDE